MDAILSDRARRMAEEMAGGVQTADDLREVMRMMTKTLMGKALDAEMDVHLGRKQVIEEGAAVASPPSAQESSTTGRKNRRNGRSAKTVQGELGEVTIATPRDRAGSSEPQLAPKYQRRMPGFDEKVLALYAKGMSTRDIEELLKQLYDVEVSPTLISAVTDAVDEEVTAWRSRPLDPVWPIVYFDGIVVHVRGANSRVSQHTVYVAIGVNLEGHKDLLGLWLAESEGAKFWLSVLTDMKNRGLNDIFVACIDGLTGFADAIRTVFEDAKVQLCVVHHQSRMGEHDALVAGICDAYENLHDALRAEDAFAQEIRRAGAVPRTLRLDNTPWMKPMRFSDGNIFRHAQIERGFDVKGGAIT